MVRFHSGASLLDACNEYQISISEAMLFIEQRQSECTREELFEEMRKNLCVMQEAVEKGLTGNARSMSGLSGGNAARLHAHAPMAVLGEQAAKAAAAAMATVEVNAAMGRIVAAPTAGASGILPGVLLTLAPLYAWQEEDLLAGLFTAGAVGMIIALRATISGAEGGCQAETGAAAAMTAAAIVELRGGTAEAALHAAAIALKNVLGLVCDPVAGLVECPCIKRNALGAVNAMLAADMALCGIQSHIPFDEVVDAMRLVGASMQRELRETAQGGLAATPTGREIARRLREV
ncbi:L-serine ammonia-lyase, iron-sulfur-dependent, subunit alpha [Christensenellaceae bacterium OttesenSCG-928-L17]|nr:L-serine ammonia-lyase, iron-sulfur-dependent, subunit alpha [Christensenellaceae bacterium OttesenSCG-928-L17]